ncbi:MAG: aldo/keto reductase [Desulfobacteraceae bacterium]|nr:aldo/keto reductase [Desulfobacteraceae bacterium]MBC2753486.1 aldo/keto reductase [Desulfobacteraceae bacterium]
MELRNLGASDIKISPIIMGTWQAGRDMWADIDDAETTRAIQAAVDAGVNTIDTAAVYGKGHSERVVGKAVGERRPQVVIATKVFANELQYDQVIAACERSLANLQTDYIDLYQIHWPSGSFGSPVVPIEETMRALTALKEQGKIRAIGVSNFSRSQLEEAMAFGDIVSLQPPYSLLWRHVEADAMPVCAAKGLSILAYSPMAQGILTGKFGPDHQFKRGDHRRANRLFQEPVFTRVQDALAALKPIADRHTITLGQLALAWVIAQPGACAIAGARNADQARENAQAGAVSLTPEDLAEMDRISRQVTAQLDDNPVLWKW